MLSNPYREGPRLVLSVIENSISISAATARQMLHRTVTAAFESIAGNYPYAKAVRECFGQERTLTYAELDWRSNMVANHLITNHNLQPKQRVVCVYSRSLEMTIFILGVLKAGCQYVPIDGSVMVEESLQHVIHDSDAPIVLCLSSFEEKVERSMPLDSDAVIVAIDALDPLWRRGDTRNPEVPVGPYDGAYAIYTSGTTGAPKGVDVTHEGTCNTLLNEPGKLGITVGTNVSSVLMLGFDMCAWEILGTLMNGGCLNLRGSSGRGGDKDVWASCLSKSDVVIATPSAAQKYLPRHEEFPNIKTIAVGGEPCPLALAQEWAPHVRFLNVCGPTEISILNTAHTHKLGAKLSIGRPNPNTNVYILDEKEFPVKIGEPGLMWVGGLGVTRGYLNLPELTAQRYRPDKFTRDGRMMFNTGDLCRWLDNGEIEPLGRQDDQVKIKGVRIELDGVSASVESFRNVAKACALKIGEQLWAFYSCHGQVDETELKMHLANLLAHYSRPSRLVRIEDMPMTPGGKIDKKALRTMEESILAAEKPMTPPATPPTAYVNQSDNQYQNQAQFGQPMAGAIPATYQDANNQMISLSNLEKGLVPVRTKSNATSVNSYDDIEVEKAAIELPQKNGFHGGRYVRHKLFNAYRKLFLFIFMINLFVFIGLAAGAKNGLPLDGIANAVAANLLIAIVIRNEYGINFVFWLATRVPKSAPLWIRRHFARCYHLGGLHSGAAICATGWWVIFAVQSTIYFVRKDELTRVNIPTVVLTFLILAILLAMLVMAYPRVRMTMHDQFEWMHRFGGWTALALVWAHIAVTNASVSPEKPLANNPAIWMVAVISYTIILPWVQLRKVNVRPEPLSKHAIRLHFDYCTPKPGKGIRLTTKPLREWHGFATIPIPGKAGFSLWTRTTPASGVFRMLPLFRKVVLVATGSGIGPCLPVILAREVPVRVFWSTPNPETTYGREIIEGVLATDPDAVIWNTRKQGRPDMAVEAYRLYKESGAEAVAIISNAKVTSKLVYDLEARGVPAFGPIFDS
ncbi:non-ribosomal peptide synthetase [Apiospora aurea]|uniref:Non-ribosomal peptide synthetase n=1 Tax=Apiospora aurea TaxID=335848 RepID=A0ABR1QN93_9PEZI